VIGGQVLQVLEQRVEASGGTSCSFAKKEPTKKKHGARLFLFSFSFFGFSLTSSLLARIPC